MTNVSLLQRYGYAAVVAALAALLLSLFVPVQSAQALQSAGPSIGYTVYSSE